MWCGLRNLEKRRTRRDLIEAHCLLCFFYSNRPYATSATYFMLVWIADIKYIGCRFSGRLKLVTLLRALAVSTAPPWKGSTTIRLRTFRLRDFVYRHFVYRHFVYYSIPACKTVIHPTSVSANHYFHHFQLLLTLWFLLSIPLPLTLW